MKPSGGSSVGPPKFYKIGEVMQYSGLSRQTLHNYTMMGLIKEAERTPSGHRLYPEDVFERLKKIEMLRRHRSLREVQEVLRKEDETEAKKA
jgi:MerR family mercuric resistance operon transcriptional regulator